MKNFFVFFAILFSFSSVFAVDPYVFVCDQNGVITEALPGLKKAPNNPVVSLNIKVITTQVQLYLIKAKVSTGIEKNIFATDWVSPTLLSDEGKALMDLLELFFNIKASEITALRAAIPTDLLDGFAYLEIKDVNDKITKLAFQGTSPTECK